MRPKQEQLNEWGERYFCEDQSKTELFVQEVAEWVVKEIAQEFDRKEQAGAKGYGPSLPAKLVRQFGSPSGPTLKQLSLLALNELVPVEDREKSSYKLLLTVISTLPETPTNTL
jgi:hypothetical protein